MYLISPQTLLLKTSIRKFRDIYLGLLAVYKTKDKFQYILIEFDGKILNDIFYFNRIKQAYLRTAKGTVSTLMDLKTDNNFRD